MWRMALATSTATTYSRAIVNNLPRSKTMMNFSAFRPAVVLGSLASLIATPVLATTKPATDASHAWPTVVVFDTAEALTKACDEAVAAADASVQQLIEGPSNTFLADWDASSMALEDVLGPAYLQAYVHPNADIRKAGEACILKANALETRTFQNEALYKATKATQPSDKIAGKFQRDLLETFEDKGVALPEAKRARAAEILQLIEQSSQEFSRNIRENSSKLQFKKTELAGLPASYLKRVKRTEDGGIEVGFDYPEVFPFLTYADDAEARKRYYIAFTQRGTPRNLELLEKITTLRKEYAGLYDLDSFAELTIRRRMAGSEQAVLDFLAQVRSVLNQTERADLFELRTLKSELSGSSLGETRINPWDKEYYLEKIRKARFDIDQEALRKYFPTDHTQNWILQIVEQLYGVSFEKVDTAGWHEDVQVYHLRDSNTGQPIGAIYLDLFPRDGKYKHAAAFGVRSGSTAIQRLPATVLVTNFNRQGLTHREVSTFLHEIGHALHGVLSDTRYGNQAGTSVERDFVEAPSQMFEEWGRKAQTLSLLQQQCSSCPRLSESMIERLDAARRFGKGLGYSRQHLYASFDMQLASANPGNPLTVWKNLEGRSLIGHAPGSQFPGTFAHIAGGYAAGYYGYMWSEAIALDMLSAFNGKLMDTDVGARFRTDVLARGGEQTAQETVKGFLGRPVAYEAFFNEIQGLKR